MTAHLVGREPELKIVSAIVDALSDGRGGLLLILGEPGIGKTRLAEAVVERAAELGAQTAWATAWQHSGAPPLWLWEQVIRQLDCGELLLTEATEVVPAEADAARFRQFDAVGRALVGAADESPVVIVLDDLQWADVASLRLLAFVVEATRGHPCLLVGTCRQDELPEAELASLSRLGTSVLLGGLDDRSVGEVLAQAMGDSVADEVVGMVAGRSGGNPLFVWEFGRFLNASGRTEVAEAAVPPAAAVLIRRRLARFSEPVMAVLQGGAVLGKTFSVDLLERVLANDEPGVDLRTGLGPGDLRRPIGAAVARGVRVRPRPRPRRGVGVDPERSRGRAARGGRRDSVRAREPRPLVARAGGGALRECGLRAGSRTALGGGGGVGSGDARVRGGRDMLRESSRLCRARSGTDDGPAPGRGRRPAQVRGTPGRARALRRGRDQRPPAGGRATDGRRRTRNRCRCRRLGGADERPTACPARRGDARSGFRGRARPPVGAPGPALRGPGHARHPRRVAATGRAGARPGPAGRRSDVRGAGAGGHV